MTPAEELRAAADKVRNSASEATGAPWEDSGDVLWIGGPIWGYQVPKEGFLMANDLAWLALMDPEKGELLADLLDDQAGVFEVRAAKEGADIAERIVLPALRLARAINGGRT